MTANRWERAARYFSPGFALAALLVVIALQQWLSQDLAQRTASNAQDHFRDVAVLLSSLWGVTKLLVVIPAIILRVLNRVRGYYIALLLSLIVVTFELLLHVVLLVADPVVNNWQGGYFLLRDNILLILINVNGFALWYYLL